MAGMSKTSRPHDEAVVELLQQDPALADEYLAAALEKLTSPEAAKPCWPRYAISPKHKA